MWPREHSGVVETTTQAWHPQISQLDGHTAAIIHCSVKKKEQAGEVSITSTLEQLRPRSPQLAACRR